MLSVFRNCPEPKRRFRFGSLICQVSMLLGAVVMASYAGASSDREQALQNLLQRHADSVERVDRQIEAERSQGKRAAMHFASHKQAMALQKQAMALYRKSPSDDVSFQLLLFAISLNPHGGLNPEICRAFISHHLGNPKLYLAMSGRQSMKVFNKDCERLYKAAAASGANVQVKDVARVRLASIYRTGAGVLANMSELKMTPEQYITSEARARNEKIPLALLEKLRKHSQQSGLLERDWREMRSEALALADQSVVSRSQLMEYRFNEGQFQEVPGGWVSDEASTIAFQIKRAMPGAMLTDFGATNLAGDPVSFNDYRGKVILLELWATWCKPCRSGMQELRSLKREMQGQPFEVITVSLDKSPDDVSEFMQHVSMPFQNWYIGEDKTFMNNWPISPLPKRFIVDGSGQIRVVPRLGYSDLREYVATLVDGQAY